MKNLIFFFIFCITINTYAKDIIFGVVPQQSASILAKKWIPIIRELSKITGLNIIFKTESSIPKFEKELYKGKYDIAYMNPYHFVIAHKIQNYFAIARSEKKIQGIIVSKKIDELKANTILGKTFLFPAPKAFAATLLTKYEIKKNFNVDIDKECRVLYVNSHDSVYKGISREIGDLGGGVVRTFKNLADKSAKKDIKILYTTNSYPSHPIAINPKLSKDIIKSLSNGLFKIPLNLLQKLNIPKLIQTSNEEYDSVKDLAIKLHIY